MTLKDKTPAKQAPAKTQGQHRSPQKRKEAQGTDFAFFMGSAP